MKRLALCLDGTWNQIDAGHPTNVVKMAQAICPSDADGTKQLIYYDEGVGTADGEGFLDDLANYTSGAFGFGLEKNLIDAYSFLVLNYEPGDEIYVFGFSRGAFTARSLCGLVRNCGIVDRRHLAYIREAVDLYRNREKDASPDTDFCRAFRTDRQSGACLAQDLEWLKEREPDVDHEAKPRIEIRYLGVWDTVGSLGLPVPDALKSYFNARYGFHNTRLSKFVRSARHAVAADETRNTFDATLWSNIDNLRYDAPDRYDEKIFPGTHGGVGGGGPIVGLSDAAFEWIYRGAEAADLAFDTSPHSVIARLQPNHLATLHNVKDKNAWSIKDKLMGLGTSTRFFPNLTAEDLHESVTHRYHDARMKRMPDGEYRPDSLRTIFESIENRKVEIAAVLNEQFSHMLEPTGILTPPKSVKLHTIQPGDTLRAIAAHYFREPAMANIIFVHNFQLGKLHDADRLYVGREIEIPYYDLGVAGDG